MSRKRARQSAFCAAAEVIVNPVRKYVLAPQKDSYAVIKIFEQMKKMKLSKVGVLSSNTDRQAGKEQIEKLAPDHAYRSWPMRCTTSCYRPYGRSDKGEGIRSRGDHQLVDRAGQSDSDRRTPDRSALRARYSRATDSATSSMSRQQPGSRRCHFPCGTAACARALSKNDPQKTVLMDYKRSMRRNSRRTRAPLAGTPMTRC